MMDLLKMYALVTFPPSDARADARNQVTTCGSDLHAVNDAYVKNSRSLAVTGVVGLGCRHSLVRQNSVADLQKGEK